ncbi:hypothetical protein Mpt1_c03160 [Candidatus Methanoplasma termitum]|uniref:Uncharacterized protein n=1 Tax=Candidatus Methanoplasma termitum TaxID=1577791 RepID=A0A0A7LAW3_9ARCH|nr:hypothetical protein [Candidatus Methanoplasma termitum]AIZ56214.1 hypothetical protein Mpt1_c03160 [Candidatus Methanoplasma termitum]MCL2334398.1 hypothetical protein [Candidatus Methanoplasma sp.]
MKIFSTHFVLKGKSDYKNLAPVFPDILRALLEEIGQMPEEEEIFQMFVDMNMVDLERNRKPEGYNRKGKMRLIFPMDRKEFYLKAYSKTTDMSRLTETIRGLLTSAGVKFDIVQNDRTDFD